MTMPDRIWAMPVTDDAKAGAYYDAANMPLAPSPTAFCYRRADLPPTLAQALALPEIAALVDAAMPYVSPVQNADYGRQLRQHSALVSAIAKVKK